MHEKTCLRGEYGRTLPLLHTIDAPTLNKVVRSRQDFSLAFCSLCSASGCGASRLQAASPDCRSRGTRGQGRIIIIIKGQQQRTVDVDNRLPPALVSLFPLPLCTIA